MPRSDFFAFADHRSIGPLAEEIQGRTKSYPELRQLTHLNVTEAVLLAGGGSIREELL